MTTITELEALKSAAEKKATDYVDDRTNYHYWIDQAGFFQKQIDQHLESNRLFKELQIIEERIGKFYDTEKKLRNGATVACAAISDAHEHVQRAKTAIAWVYTGD